MVSFRSKAAKVNSKGGEAPKIGGDLYKIEFNDDLSLFKPFCTHPQPECTQVPWMHALTHPRVQPHHTRTGCGRWTIAPSFWCTSPPYCSWPRSFSWRWWRWSTSSTSMRTTRRATRSRSPKSWAGPRRTRSCSPTNSNL
jgi:hypothetical protein